MLRKIGIGITALAMVTPGFAIAIEVGRHQLHSYLNEPLSMDVPITDLDGVRPDQIRVSLAPDSAFDAVGIDLDFFLRQLTFEVSEQGRNGALLTIRSERAVREPFLNFLVDVNWPDGKLMREFSVLLDPPSYADDPAISAPQVSRPATSQAPTTPSRPAVSRPAAADSVAAETDARQTRQVSAADTLWGIASDARPSSNLSVQQTLVAIQQLNEHAFIDGNVNLVREGAVLRLPTAEEVQAVSAQDAVARLDAQNNQFEQARQQRTATQQPTMVGSDGEDVESAEAGPSEGQLRLISEASDAATNGSSSGDGTASLAAGGLQDELARREETIDQLTRDNAELSDQISDLREQIQTAQRLMTLQSQQLDVLQQRLMQEGIEVDETIAALADQDGVAVDSEAAVTDDVAAPAASDGFADIDSLAAADQANQQAASDAAVADDSTEQTRASSEAEAQPPAVSDPAVDEMAPPMASGDQQSTGIVDAITRGFWYIALAAVAVLLLILLVLRRRKKESEESQESIETAPRVAPAADQQTDPLLQANVYAEAGQHQQAIDYLRHAINQSPSRTDLKIRLLELLKEHGDEGLLKQQVATYKGTHPSIDAAIASLGAASLSGAVAGSQDDDEDEIFAPDSPTYEDDEVLSLDDLSLDLDTDANEDLVIDDEGDNSDESLPSSDAVEPPLSWTEEPSSSLPSSAAPTPQDAEELDEVDAFSFDFESDSRADDTEQAKATADDSAGASVVAVDDDNGAFDLDLSDELDDSALHDLEQMDVSGAGDEEDVFDLALDDLPELEDVELDSDIADDQGSAESPAGSEKAGGEASSSSSTAKNVGLAAGLAGAAALAASQSGDKDEPEFEPELELDPFEETDIESSGDALEVADAEPFGDLDDLDFDFESVDGDSIEQQLGAQLGEPDIAEDESSAVEQQAADDDVAHFDTELSDFDIELSDIEADVPASSDDLNVVGVAMPEPASDSADDATPDAPSAPLDVPGDSDQSGLSVSPSAVASEPFDEDTFDFIDSDDENATRLDLAQAYIDMGDDAGAREMLDEVLAEGNPEQQAQAKSLLESLDQG